MFKFLLQPKWIGLHLACVFGVILMINLGFWQLRRLDERQTFNERVISHSQAPEVPLSELIDAPDPLEVDYRPVVMTGTYLTDEQFEIINLSQDGTTGRDMVNALRLDDGSLVIVNRGFVPNGAPSPPAPTGEVVVHGRLRRGKGGGTGQAAGAAEQAVTEIRRIDVAALGQQLGEPVAPMYVDLLGSTPAERDVVKPVPMPELGEGPHLGYAVQWFLFTVCVVVGWGLAVARKHGEDAEAAGRPPKKRRGLPPIADGDEVVRVSGT
ncbi:MAG: SURF1 family protein [Actinomycetota bacterium]|nr:SURF1 family protein [Actinomycetota bacterium]